MEMKTFNKTYTDIEDMSEWLICPVCEKQINVSVDQMGKLLSSKNLHHIFGGAYKKASEALGYVSYLHPECHRRLHDSPSVELDLQIKAEQDYLENHTKEEFISIFGQDYESLR